MTRLTRCARRSARKSCHERFECPIVKTQVSSILTFLTTITLFSLTRGRQRTLHFKSSSYEPNRLQRLQVFDQIVGLFVIQSQPEKAVVVLDDIIERRKAPVMEEATLRMVQRPLSGAVR